MRDVKAALESYIAGEKMTVIAARYGVTQPTVSYWVKRHGKSMAGKRYLMSKRKQGRRRDTEPNERDKKIILFALLGVPVVRIANAYGVSRSRANFIIATWDERGYVPENMFKPGQTIMRPAPGSDERYTVLEVSDFKTGKVCSNAEPDAVIENFPWYASGKLCEIVDDEAERHAAVQAAASIVYRTPSRQQP
jgi:transposase